MALGAILALAAPSIIKEIGGLFKGAGAAKAAKKTRKRTKNQRTKAYETAEDMRGATNQNIGAFKEGYLDRNRLQKDYVKTLKSRAKSGALPVGELESAVASRVGETARTATSEAAGFAASRGLEGSGVTASLTGRVRAVEMQQIARQARAIRIQNESTKITAQNQLGFEGDKQSDLRRDLSRQMFMASQGRDTAFYGAKGATDRQYYTGASQAADQALAAKHSTIDAFSSFVQASAAAYGGSNRGGPQQMADGTYWQQSRNGQWQQVRPPGGNIQGTPYTQGLG